MQNDSTAWYSTSCFDESCKHVEQVLFLCGAVFCKGSKDCLGTSSHCVGRASSRPVGAQVEAIDKGNAISPVPYVQVAIWQ